MDVIHDLQYVGQTLRSHDQESLDDGPQVIKSGGLSIGFTFLLGGYWNLDRQLWVNFDA